MSLVEVLIAIGIIGLLLSLLTPAIQSAREAARRTQCLSNLRQVGLALQEYHGVNTKFPPAMIWVPAGEPLGMGLAPPGVFDRVSAGLTTANEPDRVFANWLLMMLPFLEEQSLYETYDRTVPVAAPANEAVRATDIPVLKCPSDGANDVASHFQRAGPMLQDAGYARGNYAMNVGPNERCLVRLSAEGKLETCLDGFQVNGTDLRLNTSQVWGSGIGGVNRSFRSVDLTSGTSRTVAIEEIRAGINSVDRRGVWALGFAGCSTTAAHGKKGNGGPNAGKDGIQGCSALVQLMGNADLQGMPCRSLADPRREVCDQATARSLHFSGINLIMADGSGRFVSNDIESDLWEMMHKRNNQVPVALEFDK